MTRPRADNLQEITRAVVRGAGTMAHSLGAKLVVEVEYDHFNQGRFRHGTNLRRFRPDKAPRQCTFEQVGTAGSTLEFYRAVIAAPRR